jgi:hypothetical protein
MADDSALVLQKTVVARLRADTALTALVAGRVYDEPPQDVAFPYVRIGNIDVSPYRDSCTTADELVMSIECHSRPTSGRVEATQIAAAVRQSLDQAALTLTGFTLEWLDFLTQSVTRAPDGRTYIAVVAFEVSIAPAP